MAKVKYKEHLQLVNAVQWKGDNLAEVDAFVPGLVGLNDDGSLWAVLTSPKITVHVTDWIIEDPYVGCMLCGTNQAFQARFDASPVP
jgi:hypothetical protein